MGKPKHIEKILELFDKSPVVDFGSIKRVVNKEKTSRKNRKTKETKGDYAKLLVSNLLKSGRIKRLGKGYYTKYNDNSLSVFCYSPSYLGLQSALSIHGLWEQETIPVIITSKKVRTGIRKVLGGNILIRRTQKKFVFGIEYLEDGGFFLPYSDIEKTVIDMIVFRQHLSSEVLKNFERNINKNKLKNYLKKYDKRIQKKVLEKLDLNKISTDNRMI